MSRPIAAQRGLQDIRTAATGAGLSRSLPHRLHMRLCCLEMERHRRDQERRVALQRAEKCQRRCDQIESEVRALLEEIGSRQRTDDAPAHAPGPAPVVGERRPAVLTHWY